jgi:parvulin-like peptidyl-prolyl isomerase
MRKILWLSVLAGYGLWAQTPVDPLNVPPETVIGIVDGAKVTAAELQLVVTTGPPQLQEALKKDPTEMLRYYGLIMRLGAMAEAAKLDRESPQRERLRVNRMQILAEAQLDAQYAQVVVLAEEQRKFYEDNRSRYSTAKVKVIYLPFMANPPKLADPQARKIMNEAEAREKAAKLAGELRRGADFLKLVKEHSEHADSAAKDGDFGVIRGSDKFPDEVKNGVLGAKPGTIAGPIRLGNGFYIFRVEESNVETYDQVKDRIFSEIKEQRWQGWMNKVRTSVEVKLP